MRLEVIRVETRAAQTIQRQRLRVAREAETQEVCEKKAPLVPVENLTRQIEYYNLTTLFEKWLQT